MIKNFIFALCAYILFSNFVYANWFDGKIPMRVCNNGNSVDALSCNNKCDKGDIDFEFQVNVVSNIVLQKVYTKGKLFQTNALKNCKVIDKRNWICETIEESNFLKYEKYEDKHVMNDGVYANITLVNNIERKFPTCAK